MKALYAATGFALGNLCAIIMYFSLHVPKDDKVNKLLKEANELNGECIGNYSELLDTTQSIINAANACVELLWHASPEDLEVIRRRERPQALPNITTKPIILEPTVDPTYL